MIAKGLIEEVEVRRIAFQPHLSAPVWRETGDAPGTTLIITDVGLAASHRIPRLFGLDPIRDVQVLCPMNRDGVGARSLDVELQKVLNPANGEFAI